ncbi:endonuclease/exonuclease/phosphatase family protein [Spongiimicrobium salis]
MRIFLPLFFWAYFMTNVSGQQKANYTLRTVAFYNVENLFDVVDDSLTFDDSRTPEGRYRWSVDRYQHKIGNLAKVIAGIGSEISKESPDIIGLCEVENKAVLHDLISHSYLKEKNYGIIHYESPDERGIDVALLYKKGVFVPRSFKSHRLLLFDIEGKRDYTRDQLVVSGTMDSETFHFIVNHWPSRSGGERRSRPYRIAAARLNYRILDSLTKGHPKAKILSMGDFNDDPIDDSMKKVLQIGIRNDSLAPFRLYNPMEALYKKGEGSLAYRDRWNLFDQIFFSATLLHAPETEHHFWKAGIYRPNFIRTPYGKYKGYPLRSFSGINYTAGYSDHFPVYIHLIKRAN